MSKRSLLVTGGAGFIGANFVHYWLKSYPDDKIVVIDSLTYAGNLANLRLVSNNENFTFIRGDVSDQTLGESLLSEYRIDTLVHFAAESHVDRSIAGPDEFIKTNIIGTYSLLKAAKNVWLDNIGGRSKDLLPSHRFHHVSTDEVFGTLTPNAPAFTEESKYAPNSPYSASKAASDHLVRAYHHTYGLNITISNCSNNYGPFHFPEKLIPLLIVNILQNKPLPVYGDGLQVRDWLYVEDHAYGIDLILQNGKIGESYNIGGNNEWKNIDIVKAVCSAIEDAFSANPFFAEKFPNARALLEGRVQDLITYVTDRPGHDRRYAINPSKTESELGYKPRESFESGLVKTVNWYLSNSQWWQEVLDGSYREYKL